MKIYLLKRKNCASCWYNYEPMLGGVDDRPLGYYAFVRKKHAIKEKEKWTKTGIDMEIITFTT